VVFSAATFTQKNSIMKKLLLYITGIGSLLCYNRINAQCSVTNSVSTASLVLHIPFTNGSGTDISGNNLDATLVGSSAASSKAGVVNQAAYFNGSTNAGGTVAHNALLNATNQLSIAMWFNSGNITTLHRLVDKINGTITNNFLIDIYQAKPRFFLGSGSVLPANVLTANTWYFIAATYDGATAKLYLNGNLIGSTALTGNLVSNTNPLKIGMNQSNGNNINGRIDDLKIYLRALSQTEVTYLYETPEFSMQPPSYIGLCTNNLSINTLAVSTNTPVTYKWKKGNVYLTDNSTYSGTGTNVLQISNGTSAEYGKYEVEAYSGNCIKTISDTVEVGVASVISPNTTGLILSYPFNDLSGMDISGNNLPATLNNCTAGNDQNATVNSAISMNGTGSAGTPHNNLMNVSNQLSLSCWFNSTIINAQQRLIDKLNGTVTDNFVLDLYNSQCRFYCGTVNVSTSIPLTANTWYHAAATYDGANVRLYINGGLVSSTSYTGNLTPNASPFLIGGDQIGTGHFFGNINDVKFFSRALSQAEITAMQTMPENVIVKNNLVACQDEAVTFIAGASPSNLSFQWKKNGVALTNGGNISGANTASLTISNISASDYDTYNCEVFNSNCVQVASNTATLSPGTITSVLNDNLVLYYPFNGAISFDMSGNNLNMTSANAVMLQADKDNNANQALYFTGTNSNCNTSSNALMYSNGNQVTFSMWIKPTSNANQRIVEKFDSYYLDLLSGQYRFILNSGNTFYTAHAPVVNVWEHIAVTYDGTVMKFYVNGVVTTTVSAPGIIINQNANPFQLGYASGGVPYRYTGGLDEFRFYKRALSAQDIKGLYIAGSMLQQPVSVLKCGTGSTTLTTSYLSPTPVNYQWYYNGAALTGETTASLTIANITASNVGSYVCSYRSMCNTMYSDTAVVSLLASTTITASATPSVLCTGQTLTLNGYGPQATYNWASQNAGFQIGSGQTFTYNPVASDVYSLSVVSGTCTAQTTVNVVVSTCTGINESLLSEGLSVYPNPVKDVVTIRLNDVGSGMTASIQGIDGKILRTIALSANETQLVLSDLSDGIYFMTIYSGNKKSTYKIIKQ
jgi:hypothetical protein